MFWPYFPVLWKLLPLKSQKTLAIYFRLPDDLSDQIDLALQENGQARDLITCNGELVLFKAAISRLPIIDVPDSLSRWNTLRNVLIDLPWSVPYLCIYYLDLRPDVAVAVQIA